MDNLAIEKVSSTYYIPRVNFDASTGACEIEGQSYPENSNAFYAQLIDWLEAYRLQVKGPISFDFRLQYFNSTSSKGILKILHFLKKYSDEGADVSVRWHYPEEDLDNLEEAEDFVADTGIDMELIAVVA